MAESKAERARFLQKRIRVLAQVVLTRRDDLTITDASDDDTGLDLLIDIRERNNPGMRRFGVVLRGATPRATEEQLAKVLKPALRQLPRLRETALPVCLLYFTMQDDQGYFAWLIEPVVTEEGKPKLRSPAASKLAPLDMRALDDIVQQVRRWYEALVAALKI
jgi:hypothetical protein